MKPEGTLVLNRRDVASLLTVEDQIVYQSYVNEIAIRFMPVISPYYYSEVFSHMLAAPETHFFYRKWASL